MFFLRNLYEINKNLLFMINFVKKITEIDQFYKNESLAPARLQNGKKPSCTLKLTHYIPWLGYFSYQYEI